MDGFDSALKSIVNPYRFSTVKWELSAISHQLNQWISRGNTEAEDGMAQVKEYFSLVDRIGTITAQIKSINSGNGHGDLASLEKQMSDLEVRRESLEEPVEKAIAACIRDTLAKEGIYNPLFGLKFHFPPVNFKLETPPYVLVVSPRDRIESMREVTLKQDISIEQMEEIEKQVDRLGVSSLVVELGGFGGTFPCFVVNNASLRFTVDTAIEEFIHQYLAFTPLGFRYLLDLTGISRSYEIATMNETVAGMVSKETGAVIYKEHYPDATQENERTKVTFDFNAEMRGIRKAVDEYLARGEIEQAEQFMEQQRQFLATKGYYIRNLNQAYFAFHGAYADSPASISPIGLELKELRKQSASLKEFLDKASTLTGRQDLQVAIKK